MKWNVFNGYFKAYSLWINKLQNTAYKIRDSLKSVETVLFDFSRTRIFLPLYLEQGQLKTFGKVNKNI